MSKIWQEFYCTTSGGGCGGYFMVKLNIGLNHRIEMVCPKCGHKHRRRIEDGVILEDGRFSGSSVEEICPTMSSYSKKPKTVIHKKKKFKNERDGAVVETTKDLVRDQTMMQRWVERFGGGTDAAQE